MAKQEEHLRCSFCGKLDSQVRMIAGPGVCICSDCVNACRDLLKKDEKTAQAPEKLPTPMEIKDYMDGYIMGQDDAKVALAVAVYIHY